MAGLFDWKKQPAYQAYSSHSVRPDGLPPYEVDENGFYKVAPGELYCRAYDKENAICPNDRKQWQPSNLRHHLKTTHKYTLLDLPPGKANVVDAKKIDRKLFRNLLLID
ncbi:uncharacterized protein BCR38DRAFT_421368 [Pseudomassariella vexata]|uniref:Uncharacterized protein n=1 Tax=Pseudomassariella vexata TaxID=1141098 RepID=A0A1Y2EHC6_9PEZI|nr:uncharacterized protein BCR38DRAFT_421368 [Pseudomassariella vexata]ORY70195.1 hypothetical protein BCR38DRAFT_421368 [Pseudomassariella vexata]